MKDEAAEIKLGCPERTGMGEAMLEILVAEGACKCDLNRIPNWRTRRISGDFPLRPARRKDRENEYIPSYISTQEN